MKKITEKNFYGENEVVKVLFSENPENSEEVVLHISGSPSIETLKFILFESISLQEKFVRGEEIPNLTLDV